MYVYFPSWLFNRKRTKRLRLNKSICATMHIPKYCTRRKCTNAPYSVLFKWTRTNQIHVNTTNLLSTLQQLTIGCWMCAINIPLIHALATTCIAFSNACMPKCICTPHIHMKNKQVVNALRNYAIAYLTSIHDMRKTQIQLCI